MRKKRIKTPIILQMESSDCGAVALNIILEYYGIEVEIEKLREKLGVNRDGCKVNKLLEVARGYGCNAKACILGLNQLKNIDFPCIIYWKYSHFVVYEYSCNDKVFINDPAEGRKQISIKEFSSCFTGLSFLITIDTRKNYNLDREIRFVKEIFYKIKIYKKDYFKILFISSICAFLSSSIPILFSYILDKTIAFEMDTLYYWGAILFLGWGQYIINIFLERGLTEFQEELTVNTTTDLFLNMFKRNLDFYNQRSASDLAGRYEINNKLCEFVSRDIVLLGVNLLSLGMNVLVMFFVSNHLGIIEILNVLITIYFMNKISTIIFQMELLNEASQSRLLGSIYSGVNIIRTIKALGANDKYVRRVIGYYVNYFESKKRKVIADKCLTIFQELMSNINRIIIVIVGANLISANCITFGQLVACNMLVSNVSSFLKFFMNFDRNFQLYKSRLYRVNDIVKVVPQKGEGNISSELEGVIDINNLSFGYEKGDNPILHNCNIHINSGDFVAFVGRIGCGKSTLIKLLLGLYNPWSGKIVYDKTPISYIDTDYFRTYLCCTSQNSVIFEGSVRENVTLWNNTIKESDIIQIFKIVELLDFVNIYGLDYHLKENGVNISGGEKEKICIARILIKKPKILIFDESTRSLDMFSEQRILSRIKELKITIIIVSHRIETVTMANRIFFFDDGEIIEYDNIYQNKKMLEALLNY